MRTKTAAASAAFLLALLSLLAGNGLASGSLVEAEAGSGAGQIMTRSAASMQRTAWLRAGETRQVPLTVATSGSYTIGFRYSNDNYGPLEAVSVTVDNVSIGQFTAQDTGDWGGGWNAFVWSASLGPVTLAAGSHQAAVSVSGGDGRGVEIDVLRVERAAELLVEGEAGSGDGVVQPRSAASAQRTVWLRPNQARRLTVQIEASGTHALSVRYSNDNYGPLETVNLTVDNVGVGQFAAQDTGDYGAGWNAFLWSSTTGSFNLTAGSHEVMVHVSGGDGYGIELDVVRLSPVT